MAHMYTTKRGKNKKKKESVRMDAKNNAANKIMRNITTAIKTTTYEHKESFKAGLSLTGNTTKVEMLEDGRRPQNNNNGRRTDNKKRTNDNNEEVKVENCSYPSYQRCFYALCKLENAETCVFKQCSRCMNARYCSAECQKADWTDVHKFACCKSEELLGFYTSVSIRPQTQYINDYKEKYPNDPCIVLIGAYVQSQPTLLIELFDSNYAPTGIFIDQVNPQDIIIHKWKLVENLTDVQKKKRKNDEKQYKKQVKAEKDRIRGEQYEKERIEMQIKEKERLEKERIKKEAEEKERLEKEAIENERLEKDRIEKDKIEKEIKEKLREESKRRVNEKIQREKQKRLQDNNTQESVGVNWELFDNEEDLDNLLEEEIL